MKAKSVLVVALIFVVALSGCMGGSTNDKKTDNGNGPIDSPNGTADQKDSGSDGGASDSKGSSDNSNSSTGSDTDTGSDSNTNPRYPPGVSQDGVNGQKLSAAYSNAVSNTSFKLTSNSLTELENGTLKFKTVKKVAENGQILQTIDVTVKGSLPAQYQRYKNLRKISIWINPQSKIGASKRVLANGSKNYRTQDFSGNQSAVLNIIEGNQKRLLAAFGTFETRVSDPFKRNGRDMVWINATSNSSASRNTSLKALVDSNGFVYKITRLTRYSQGSKTRFPVVFTRVETRFTNIGSTTVEKPDWVEEAKSG